MMAKETPEQVTARIVRELYNAGANAWTMQQKGVLMGAIKLQLIEQPNADT